MTDTQKKMMEMLNLSEDDFKQPTAQELAEEAYLTAEYNSILLSMLMEDET